jgi:hypothetical protein
MLFIPSLLNKAFLILNLCEEALINKSYYIISDDTQKGQGNGKNFVRIGRRRS